MAGNESVGKVSLDMEIDGDLSKQIGEAANKMAEQIKASLSNIGNFDFKGMANTISKSIEKSIDSSMKNIQSTIEKSLNKALSNAMNAIKKFKIPVEFDIPKNFSMPKMNYKVSMAQPRAPPTAKVNTGINVEALKAQIDNLTQSLDITNAKIEQQKAKLAELKESYNMAFNESRKNKLEEEILKTEAAINRLTSQSDKAGFKLADLDEQFAMLGDMAKSSTAGINEVAQSINKTSNSAAKASNNMRDLSNSTRSTGDSFRNSYGGMHMFMSSMLEWGIIFPMIAEGISSFGTFLGNSMMVNSQFANSLNLIRSNLYTAFMPIYNAVLPALNSLMSALATATAYIASFISQLFGTTYDASFGAAQAMQSQIGAYTQTQKAAKQAATTLGTVGSTASKSSDKIKKASKEAKGSVAAFDEVNQLQLMKDPTENTPKTPKAGKPEGDGVVTPIIPMPNMAPIETATAAWADKFKNILAGLWEPFKQAWSAEGVNTINAAKYALTGIESLIGAIGKSFYTVWTNGTGEKILENLLRILQDILRIIGDISITFADAWNSGNIGTQVVQHLANALNNVLSLIDKMLQSIRFVWAEEGPTFANMFMQALNAVSGVIENLTVQMGWIWDHGGQHAFEGLLKLGLKVGELALFILTNFVTPFVNWFINLISPAIAVVLDWIGKLADKLSGLITWLMGDGKPVLDIIITVLGSFALAWNGVTLALKAYYGIQGLISAAQMKFNSVLALIKSPAGIAVLAITGIITIGVLLYQHWDQISAFLKECWTGISNTAKTVWGGIKDFFAALWQGLKDFFATWGPVLLVVIAPFLGVPLIIKQHWSDITQFFSNLWDDSKKIFSEFSSWLGNVFATDWSTRFGALGNVINGFLYVVKTVWDTIKGIFSGIIDFIAGVFTGNWSRAWKGITEIFGSIFGGIVAIAKVPINGVISLINAAITELDKIQVDIPDWVPGFGGKSFGVDIPKIPYLAQGGIIDKPTLSMVGEAGKEAVVPLENNTGGLKAMAQMLSQEIKASINAGSTTTQSTAIGGISVDSTEGAEYGKKLNTSFAKGITDSANVVTSAVSTIVTNITTSINNLVRSCIQYGQNIDVNLGIGITNSMDSVMKPLTNLINKITSSIQIFIQSCIGYGINVDSSLGNGITQNSDAVYKPITNLLNSLVSKIKGFIQDCIGYGQNIDASLSTGIIENKDVVINALNNEVILILSNDLNTFATGAVQYGQGMDNSISQGISANIDTVLKAINNLTSRVGSTLQTFAQSCNSYGISIVDELGSGIQASEDNLDNIVKDLTDKVVETFRNGFGIRSPSRVMYQIGLYLMQGLINGMSSQNVSDFITKWIGDITGAAGGAASGNVSNWLAAAMMITGTPMGYLPMLENIAMNESGGNPLAINLWDSNAAAGHPSKGLMQMIDSTFMAHALPGMDDIYNPIDNAVSAIRYMISQYGSIENVPGIRSQLGGGGYVGYATGTNSARKGLGWTGELGPEMIDFSGGEAVLTAMESIKFMERAANAVSSFKSAISSFRTKVATLKQPELTMMQGRETNNSPATSNNAFTDSLTTAIVNAILTALKLNNNSQDASHIRDLILQIDGTTLARILKPYLDKENQRVGNKLILKTT